MAIVLAFVSLVLVTIAATLDGPVHWWAWALPSLVIANVSVSVLRVFGTWKRVESWFPWFSVAVAVSTVVAQVLQRTRIAQIKS